MRELVPRTPTTPCPFSHNTGNQSHSSTPGFTASPSSWRDTLSEKYSDLPGVRKYHDFLVVRAHDQTVVMKVRERCFDGQWKDSPLHVRDVSAPGLPTNSYKETQTRSISAEKMANMVTMYNRFISPDRRPEYLPPERSAPVSALAQTTSALQTPSATSTSSAPAASSPTRKRKQSKCSTVGCDGTGHKNPKKWTQGHTTKAGCPLHHK